VLGIPITPIVEIRISSCSDSIRFSGISISPKDLLKNALPPATRGAGANLLSFHSDDLKTHSSDLRHLTNPD
jgi:hypothetical protein